MPFLQPLDDDCTIREMLTKAKVIAVIGHSDKPERASYQIAQFLRRCGYIVYPVNPLVTKINDLPCYPSLKEVPSAVDIVNVFRRSEYLNQVVDQAIAIDAKTIWAQLGVYDEEAGRKAVDGGLNVVMDACIKVEYLRLGIG
ncbi:MAG: CoA-binding protein [Calothrix sp. MO_192.B10]|nr:CoA-binding protein [Calothrix sp. MO_192.B10]